MADFTKQSVGESFYTSGRYPYQPLAGSGRPAPAIVNSGFRELTQQWDNFNSGLNIAVDQTANLVGDFKRGTGIVRREFAQQLRSGVQQLNNLGQRGAEALFGFNHDYKAARQSVGAYLGNASSYLDYAASAVRGLVRGNLGLEELKTQQLAHWAKTENNFGFSAETIRREYSMLSNYPTPSEMVSKLGKAVNAFDAAEGLSSVLDTFEDEYRGGSVSYVGTMKKVGTGVFTGAIASAAGATAAIGTAAVLGVSAAAFWPLAAGAAVGLGVGKLVSDWLR